MSQTQAARLIRELWNANDNTVRDKSVKLITKVLRNILMNPTEAKFRKIKRTAIDKRLGSVVGALQLLQHVGFQTINDHYVLPETTELSNLCDSIEIFDNRAKQIEENTRQMQKVLEVNNAKAKAEMDKKEEHRKKLRAQGAQNQKEVRKKVIVESKANTLNFGMTLKQFVPPKPAKGG